MLVGRYELVRLLGEGSQGMVYAGRHALTHRTVAIKTLRPRKGGTAVARFLQEARIAAGIHHPNLVEVLDMGQDPADGTHFIVQPLLAGCSLEAILNRERLLTPHTALEFLVPILGAVIRLHQEGVIHRDIKPANILITRTKEFGLVPVLIDFGVSKMPEGPSKAAITEEGALLGTPLYMAPEQLLGERSEDAQTDVWALGVVLYQCLSGHYPYEAGSVPGFLLAIRRGPPVPLHERVRSVSSALSAVVQQAIDPDRACRFSSVQSLLRALLSCPTIEPRITGGMLARRHPDATLVAELPPHDTLEDDPAPAEPPHEELVEWVPPRIAELVPEADPEERLDRPPRGTERGPNADPASRTTRFTQNSPLDEPEPPRPPPPRRRWGIVVVGLVLLSVLAGALLMGSSDPAPPSQFEVALRLTPRSAWIRLDGRAVGSGEFRGSFPRNGQVHRIELGAPGHYGQTLIFRDAPPPREITLRAAAR